MIRFNFRYPMPNEDIRGYMHQFVDHLKHAFATVVESEKKSSVETVCEGISWSVGQTLGSAAPRAKASLLGGHTVFVAHVGESALPVLCVRSGKLIIGSLSCYGKDADGNPAMRSYSIVISHDTYDTTLQTSTYDDGSTDPVVALYAVI